MAMVIGRCASILILLVACAIESVQGIRETSFMEDLALEGLGDDSETTTRVVILGHKSTGKSSLCQWLLAKTDVCAVHTMGGTTEPEKAVGYWFNDPTMGHLEIIDTPGFLSDTDAVNWQEFVNYVKVAMPKVDAVIWTANANGEAYKFVPMSMNRLRLSFGTELWSHMLMWVSVTEGYRTAKNFFGLAPQAWTDRTEWWHETIREVEFNESVRDWSASPMLPLLEADLADVSFYGGQLLVKDVTGGMLQAHLAESQVPAEETGTLPQMGLDRLVEMRTKLMTRQLTRGGSWDIQHLVARFGPTEVKPDHSFECNWPKQCELDIEGVYLSNADQLQIFPHSHVCGDPFESDSRFTPPVAVTRARPVDSDSENHRKYFLGQTQDLGKESQTFTICYCQYGTCNVESLFSQTAGKLTVEAVQCEVSCPEGEDKHTVDSGFCGEELQTVKYDETVQYECKTGYGISHKAQEQTFERKCGEDGELSAATKCQKVRCENIPFYGNSAVTSADDSDHLYEKEIDFECAEGYTTDGAPGGPTTFKAQCAATGNFEIMDPKLKESNFHAHGCRRWTTAEWGMCDVACGDGRKSRSVSCEPAGAICEPKDKPIVYEPCSTIEGCTKCSVAQGVPHAKPTDLKELKDIAPGPEGVWYTCDSGYTVNGKKGNTHSLTAFQAFCKVHTERSNLEFQLMVPPYTIADEDMKGCRRWEITPWSECSVSCGTGHQERKLQCSTGTDADCFAGDKPEGIATAQSCNIVCEKEPTDDGNDGNDGSRGDALPSARAPVLAVLLALAVSFQQLRA